MQGKVIELFITHNDIDKTRESLRSISVDAFGIKDDKFYNKNPMRSILLTSIESYNLSLENGIELETGTLGENILIDVNPYKMLPGQKIKIGDAILEITQNCTLCKGLTSVNSKLPKLLKNDRGIFAKVINGNSKIHLDDTVEILNY